MTISRSSPGRATRPSTDGHVRDRPSAAGADVLGRPATVARLVQVAGVVQRDRLEEHRHRAVGVGSGDARAQHRRRHRLGWPGQAITRPGDVAQHGDRVVVVEVAAEALLVGEAGDAHDHRVGVRRPGRRTTGWLPRRAAGPRRCAGRRGTGSRGSAATPTRPRPAPGPGSTARRAGCRTPAPSPAFFCRPRVTPYTPPFTPTSSPNTSDAGRGQQHVAQRAVDRLGQRQRAPRPRAACRRRTLDDRLGCWPKRRRLLRPATDAAATAEPSPRRRRATWAGPASTRPSCAPRGARCR